MDLLRAIIVIVILDMSDVTSYADIEHIRKFTVAIGWEPDQEGMATRKPAVVWGSQPESMLPKGMATRKPAGLSSQVCNPQELGTQTSVCGITTRKFMP